MIPVRLRLRNFMSYGEGVPPLEFTNIRLACLCGDNGHGKSALLDAITWALWGRARISERRDASEDELIHLGKTEMEVEFQFELDQVRYLVLRKRAMRVTSRRRVSTAVLEFQVLDGEVYRPLTGDTMHATQRRINEVLRLDYETFVNSAFILQGRADEFTRRTATERKRILSDLLGLGYYDALDDRAREEVRRYEAERREHEAAIEEVDRELTHEPRYRRDLERLNGLLAELATEVERHDHEVTRLRGILRELELKATHQAELRDRVERGEASLKSLRSRVVHAESRLREHEALAQQGPAIRKGHSELLAARQEVAALDQRFRELHDLTGRKAEVDAAIVRARGELESDQKVVAAEMAKLRAGLARVAALREQEIELRDRLAAMDHLAEERTRLIQALENCRAQIELLGGVNAKLKEDGSLLRERLDLLAKAGATCPICDGKLDAAGRERLQARFQDERDRMAQDYRRNAGQIKALEAESAAMQGRLQAIDESLRRRQSLDRSHANVEKALQEIERSREELAAAEARYAQLAERLAAGDYARAEQEESSRLARDVEALGYDSRRHQEVRALCEELTRFEALLAKLETAEAEMPRQRADLAELAQLERDTQAEVARDRERLAELNRELAAKPEVEAQLARARQTLDEAIRRQGASREERGEAQQRLNHCQYLRTERSKRAEAQALAALEKGYYEDLALAFGKKGIQAMIIESVIPEIEAEANGVLARMTDGRLHVKFETQRDARSGDGTIETLDIRISDELGVRNLELYSGGEAFRVNFAIRIALSKLLARRAGARVQTLVIDEGFGTQDSFGRQRLIEAINSVADDFEKIIVITHIDELKDAFPTRIDVVKGPEGSQITVSS